MDFFSPLHMCTLAFMFLAWFKVTQWRQSWSAARSAVAALPNSFTNSFHVLDDSDQTQV